MSEFKVGDTVDPRTLPVGAVFRHVGLDCQFRVTESGLTAESFDGRFSGLNIGSASAILLSLPKRPPCDACGEESCPNPTCKGVETWQSEFGPAHLCRECWGRRQEQLDATIRASRTAQTSPAQLDPSSLPTYDQIAGWLGAEWVMMCSGFDEPAPRSWPAMEQPSPWTHRVFVGDYQCSLLHAPTGQRVEVTAPRSEVLTLPRWEVWFDHIKKSLSCGPDARRNWGSRLYAQHVRWLDPDTKTSAGSESATRNAAEAASAAPEKPEPVVPEGLRCPFCTSRSHSFGFMNPDGTGARAIICDECDYRAPDSDWFGQPSCSSCKQPFWAGRKEVEWEHGPALCGDCLTQGHYEPADHLTNGLDTRIAEVAEPEVRIEDMPGAWATACDEGLS